MKKEQINFFYLEITDVDDITITQVEINAYEANLIVRDAIIDFTENGYGGITMNLKIKSMILIPKYHLKNFENENR